MRIVGTAWLAVAVLCFLVWPFAAIVVLTDGFDAGTSFVAFLMLAAGGLMLFFGVLPSIIVATRRGIWVYGEGVIPWGKIDGMRVTSTPFTWLDGYAVEITTPRGDRTLLATATYLPWGARRKQRVLHALWQRNRDGHGS